ncbi:pyrimidine-nucleoside phosphorylase [Kandleria vitulina]|uniref:Pyrimidine-nucleoside phosphorylase n=1 Tax=Kandleria vitulina TaxID=1630 RepID=A0A1H2UJJ3_9FIRM|nr:pyrimidine-nucleoside phosphorylase [Kandleria vitulina]SDW55674.1 pyrimidine-nucleoside phosphorylase [Kandleria vitulina]HAD23747.1 pyrimidine-nucleoside phosphorylase [Kandleria vitulina]
MRMVDLIEKKKNGEALSKEEIHFIIDGYVKGDIPDYQMSAWMMAVYFKGMTTEEIATLTLEMMHSGDVLDLSEIKGIKIDKHSTGGVGDKTSLAVGPMVAACGVPVAKMSGRGLGHTGGTLDKLESIPGLNIAIEENDFIKQVNEMHFSIIGQTGSLVPADKKMYALRDVTGTVNSIPLIASSIMSKKLAAGADGILLDVKYGDGAFMKTIEDARVLAKTMIEIGKHLGKDTRATISNMNQPLGNAIGNALEVKEAIATLNGEGPEDFTSLCFEEGETMLMMAHVASSREEAKEMLHKVIEDKSALNVFKKMVEAQGGDGSYITDPSKFKEVKEVIEVTSSKEGYIEDLEALTLGLVSMKLGGGRATVDDVIDHSVGLVLHKKIGDYVKQGESLLSVYTNTGLSDELREEIISAYHLTSQTVKKPNIVEETL